MIDPFAERGRDAMPDGEYTMVLVDIETRMVPNKNDPKKESTQLIFVFEEPITKHRIKEYIYVSRTPGSRAVTFMAALVGSETLAPLLKRGSSPWLAIQECKGKMYRITTQQANGWTNLRWDMIQKRPLLVPKKD